MAKIQEILKRFGVDDTNIDSITESIEKEYVGESFVSKKQYQKRIKEVDDLQEKVNDLEAKGKNGNTDEYKSKFETLEKEYNDYKSGIETEKINNGKLGKLKEQLKAEGLNEKLVNLMLKEFDLSKVELEEDKIKGWEELSKPVKENYAEFFKVEEIQQGTPPVTPPHGELGKKQIYIPPTMF